MESMDVALPSESAGAGGTLALRLIAPRSGRAFFSEGAPVVVHVPGGFQLGDLSSALPDGLTGFVNLSFLFPGGTFQNSASGGKDDYRGPNAILALRDILLFASGKKTEAQGRTIDRLLSVPVLTENVGMLTRSNGGVIAIVVMALYGEQLPGVRYIIGWENPTNGQAVLADGGPGNNIACPNQAVLWLRRSWSNPYYSGYGAQSWSIDYSRITWDASTELLFLDGNGDRQFNTITDAGGCRISDLNRNSQVDAGEDFGFRSLVHAAGEKRHYSMEVIRAAIAAGLFSTWPSTLDTLADAEAYWQWRESTRYYDRLPEKRPDVKLLIAASQEDHVQSVPGKPHIRQAFEGFARNGMWVKMNPSPASVSAVSPALAGRRDLPDLAANRAPADWTNYSYAYPEDVTDEIYQGAATRELAELIQRPRAAVASVLNAASYASSVAPGGLIAIFGASFAADTVSATATPLPRALLGSYVLIDGRPAPLLFASPGQINAQIPWEVRPGKVNVVVNDAKTSVTVSEAAPGIFKLQGERAAITPVPPGQYVTLYLTGQGPVQSTPASGAPAPDTPLSWTTLPVSATIGGKPADVQFAGLAPRMVGVMQANLRVPDLPAGDHPVVVTVGGVASNTAMVPVAAR